jgi:hypothetical protein
MYKRLLILALGLAFCLSAPVNALTIEWVSELADEPGGGAGDGVADDQGWIDLLAAQGYDVSVRGAVPEGENYNPYWMELDGDKIAELNAADLVIISRNTNSGNYDDGDEPTQWNSVTTPLILMNSYIARSSRWKWMNTTSMATDVGTPLMEAIVPGHPVFNGVELTDGQLTLLDGTVDSGRASYIVSTDVGNGTLIAQSLGGEYTYIAEWATGTEGYEGSGQTLAANRMLFSAGSHGVTGGFGGTYNLTPEGEQVFLNAVAYIPEPATIALLGLGSLALIRRRK